MTDDKELGPKDIRVTDVTPGHAHTVRKGICGCDVTVEDIKAEFYHSLFGGRDAYVHDGAFQVTTHDD